MTEQERDELYQRAVRMKDEFVALQEFEKANIIRELLGICQEYETSLQARKDAKA